MSVWRRLQRVGKKAAKFQITASLHELNIECSRQYSPGNLIVVWSRRSRRYSSKSFEPVKSSGNSNSFKYVWSMPENIEFVTTLYRNEKAIQFEEKEWICQIEDVGAKTSGLLAASTPSVRRRVLATRQIDIAEFVSDLPVQTNLKVVMRLASKKLISATVLLTLNSVIVKAGEATDEDMISIASLMSLSRTGSFNVGSGVTINDLGGVAAFSPTTARLSNVDDFNSHSFSNSTFHTDLSELTAKLQSLERRQIDPLVESPIKANGNFSDYSSELDNSKITLNSSKNQDSLSSTVDDMLTKPLIPTFDKTIPNSTELKPISTQSRYDLLRWCQLVTKSYDNIQIVDLTTSFQNGLAFCAILHHFFPDRIDYNSLSSENPLQNCRLAFDVASKLGVPRVLDPSEVVSKSRSPDLLSMMTYLHQIRTFCCERTKNNDENSPCTNDNLVLNGIFEQCIKTNNSETNHSLQKIENPPDENSNNAKNNLTNPDKAVRSTPKKKIPLMNYEHMLAKARSLLQQSRLNYLAPTSRPGALPPLAHPRKPHPISGSLTAIHSVDENFNRNPVTEESLTNITLTDGQNHRLTDTKLCTKHRKSHKTLYRFNSDGTICIPNVDTSLNSISKPFRFSTSNIFPTLSKPPQSTVDTRFSPEQMKVRRLRLSQMNLFASGRGSGAPVPIRIGEHHLDNKMDNRTHVSTSIKNQGTLVNNSSSNALLSVSNYISNEQAELEEAQKKLDKEAAVLEQRLRQQMAYEPGTALEEELLRRWFILVNKKNALIHRGFQLSIMEKEDDLKKKMKMLQDELRSILSVEDYLKTDNDRRREDLLLQDLVRLVNERDDIIQELDLHEKV
uniref:EH domain-binding protein 1 n=2 Tax=Schistosoma TaxID=6181 RepID=A0A095CAN5_SCHHA